MHNGSYELFIRAEQKREDRKSHSSDLDMIKSVLAQLQYGNVTCNVCVGIIGCVCITTYSSVGGPSALSLSPSVCFRNPRCVLRCADATRHWLIDTDK